MNFNDKITQIKKFMIDEIIDACEGGNLIILNKPLCVKNHKRCITQIQSNGDVHFKLINNPKKDEKDVITTNLDSLSVEIISIILDHLDSKQFLIY
jgi:hypothetical protein